MAKSFLSKEQINLLNSCMAGANLAADIAHAHVYLYVRDEDPKHITVYGQALPLKEFVTHSANIIGRKLRLAEEPLVGRTLQSGMVVTGKRESMWRAVLLAATMILSLSTIIMPSLGESRR